MKTTVPNTAPEPVQTTGQRFVSLVKTIVLVRHAKAPKMFPDQKDEDRMVNQTGHDQAKALGLVLKMFEFDIVLSSPLKRVQQTISIATDGRYLVTEVPELNCPPKSSPVDIMFAELGYEPMSRYFEHPLGEHLKDYGRNAFAAVMRHLPESPPLAVLVGGHAVLQNALGWAICEALESRFSVREPLEMVLNTSLGDGEAFRIIPGYCGSNALWGEHIALD